MMYICLHLYSSWWGESFVRELKRISVQAEKKIKLRRGSKADAFSPADDVKPLQNSQTEDTGEIGAATVARSKANSQSSSTPIVTLDSDLPKL